MPTIDHDNIFTSKNQPGREERELPALGRSTPIDYNKVNENDFEHQKPDQTNSTSITLKVDKKLAPSLDRLTSILGPEMAKKACADKWYFQQEAITNTISELTNILNDKPESDTIFLIGYLANVCSDSDMKPMTVASEKGSSVNLRRYKKTIKHFKKRLELYSSLIEQVTKSYPNHLKEVFKRLVDFIDVNDLKSDVVSLLNSIYTKNGYDSVKHILEELTTRQLGQFKNTISEVKDIIEARQQERDKNRRMIEETKTLDQQDLQERRSRRSKARGTANNPKLCCEF